MSERTFYIPDVQETIDYLRSYNGEGVVHGSTVRDLSSIEPRVATTLHVHTPTGELIAHEAAVSACDGKLVVPIFYATVFKPSRLNELIRGAAVKPVRNDRGEVVDFLLFASDAAKQVAEEVFMGSLTQKDIEPTAYILHPRNFLKKEDEVRATTPCEVLGSVAISLLHLKSLGVSLTDLNPPNSDPDIRGYYEKYGYGDETPAR